jgi:hypothetical protein
VFQNFTGFRHCDSCFYVFRPFKFQLKIAMINRAVLASSLLALLLCKGSRASSARSREENRRDLQADYYTLTTRQLGAPNPDAAIGNPLKGLVESPRYTTPPYTSNVPLSMEFYYIGTFPLLFTGSAYCSDLRIDFAIPHQKTHRSI